MRPGPNTQNSTAIPPATVSPKTGTWFVVVGALQGPQTPVLITSFAQYQRIFGARGTFSAASYDAVEAFFLEGGSRLYVCRVVGATGKAAEVKLKHSAAESIKVAAIGAGTWANTWKVVVAESGSTFTLTLKNAAGETLVVSPALSSVTDAVAWSKSPSYEALNYIVITATGTENPTAGTFELTGGTDDSTFTTPIYEAGAKLFTGELGPGNLSVPGVSTTALIEGIAKIAVEQKRRAIMPLANGASKAELLTAAAAVRALGSAARAVFLAADWQKLPPLSGAVAPRAVCPTAFVAAVCARNDSTGNPNLAPAGKQGIAWNSLGKETAFTEQEIEALYEAGVNLSKVVGGQVRLYGNRTAVSPQSDELYSQFSNVRCDMAIEWKGLAIEENFMFSQLDGQGIDLGEYGNALKGMLLGLYRVGALYGPTPQAAFVVDTAEDVNTPITVAEGDANATIAARRSKSADMVNLNLVRVSVTQEV